MKLINFIKYWLLLSCIVFFGVHFLLNSCSTPDSEFKEKNIEANNIKIEVLTDSTYDFDEKSKINTEIVFPKFMLNGKPIDDFNNTILESIKLTFSQFVDDINLPQNQANHNYFNISFYNHLLSDRVISTELVYDYFLHQAAHPNKFFQTFNYSVKENKLIHLSDMFTDVNYLETVSKQTRRVLIDAGAAPEEWIRQGTQAIESNFEDWCIKENKLVIIFENYQVAPYSMGPQLVELDINSLPNIKKEYFQ